MQIRYLSKMKLTLGVILFINNIYKMKRLLWILLLKPFCISCVPFTFTETNISSIAYFEYCPCLFSILRLNKFCTLLSINIWLCILCGLDFKTLHFNTVILKYVDWIRYVAKFRNLYIQSENTRTTESLMLY